MGKLDSLEFALRTAKTEALSGFELFESSERYGAYQWTFRLKTEGRCNYVVLALRDAEGTAYESADLEVWAAADQENRFGRAKVAELLSVPVEAGEHEVLYRSLVFLLTAARMRAEKMGFHELTERYVEPPAGHR